MLETSHVLITGAAGLIGASVARVLVDQGVRVTGLDDLSAGRIERLEPLLADGIGSFRFLKGDVRDRDLLLRALLGGDAGASPNGAPDHGPVTSILHLAGRVGVRRVLMDPQGCEEENLDLGRSVAAAVRLARGQGRVVRVVAASTSEVYAESDQPLSESSVLRPLVAEGRWRYAASKRAAEEVLDRVVKGAVHLRFFNVVGPGQDGGSGMVLPRFIEAARRGEALRVHGRGTQVRTFAHVDAVARDVAALAAPEVMARHRSLEEFEGPLNLGGAARATILELAEEVRSAVASATGSPPAHLELVDPIVDVAGNFEDVRHRVPDLGRLRSLGLASAGIGSAPWSLTEIVRDTVQRHVAPGQGHPAGDAAGHPSPWRDTPCELPVS